MSEFICRWCDPQERNVGMFQQCQKCEALRGHLYAFMRTKNGSSFVKETKEKIEEDREEYRKTHCFICDVKIEECTWFTHPQCEECRQVTNNLDDFLESVKGIQYVKDKIAGKVAGSPPVYGSSVLDDDHNG